MDNLLQIGLGRAGCGCDVEKKELNSGLGNGVWDGNGNFNCKNFCNDSMFVDFLHSTSRQTGGCDDGDSLKI
ncbi:hypothetical protein T01_12997 [Trichinella spiralis]|uniref:Uncharacterized protein n=1 Tax=Trichinella spiralis TaxID=6334 RepID=A0A0V1B6V7_TRISP|nr:hypothetical protein T01_12997 [Trichinella spiralis]